MSCCEKERGEEIEKEDIAKAGGTNDEEDEDEEDEEDEDEIAVLPCPICEEPVEEYWNICPKCQTNLRSQPSMPCAECKKDGTLPMLSLKQVVCTVAAPLPVASEDGVDGVCCRVVSPQWQICPDCKQRLKPELLVPFDPTSHHLQRNLFCTICPKMKYPRFFCCSAHCANSQHRISSQHAYSSSSSSSFSSSSSTASSTSLSHSSSTSLSHSSSTSLSHSSSTSLSHSSSPSPFAASPPPLFLETKWKPVPQLRESAYELADEQVQFYRERGHVLLPGLMSREEIEAFFPWLIFTAQRKYSDSPKLGEKQGAKPFYRAHNLWQENEVMAELVLSQRFARVAARLLGVERLRLYQDSIFFKESKDLPSPWHQDLAAAPFDSDLFGTLWITFTDISSAHGPLQFAEGSHLTDYKTIGHRPCAADRSAAPPSRDGSYAKPSAEQLQQLGFPISQPPLSMVAGDATFHSGWTFHGASANCSPDASTRYALVMSFFADGVTARADSRLRIMDDYPTISLLLRDNLRPSAPITSKWTPRLI